MILKVLLVIAVIAIVYFMFIKKKPLSQNSKKNREPKEANDMIECSTCGVYTEISECILSNGKYYCSSECIEKVN